MQLAEIGQPTGKVADLLQEGQSVIAKRLILGNKARLRPDGIAGRRFNTAHDDIANLALGVTTDGMDNRVVAG